MMHNDAFGRGIAIDDLVAWSKGASRGNYAGFDAVYRVIKLTPKMVRVSMAYRNVQGVMIPLNSKFLESQVSNVEPANLIVVNDLVKYP